MHGYWTGKPQVRFREDCTRSAKADTFQVMGTAIAINILIPKIPLVAGCALSITDTLFILLFYKPDGSLKTLRVFELFIAALVLGVFISFCIELSLIKDASVGDVFDGFLPSKTIFQSDGYILGAFHGNKAQLMH